MTIEIAATTDGIRFVEVSMRRRPLNESIERCKTRRFGLRKVYVKLWSDREISARVTVDL